eukprot:snap_masked-scaffold_19-processed-gene-1.44-mRNA-1 protein AED:1.00 eAED:1.00 QI:0/-1/0/0/-1/1/1/0/367
MKNFKFKFKKTKKTVKNDAGLLIVSERKSFSSPFLLVDRYDSDLSFNLRQNGQTELSIVGLFDKKTRREEYNEKIYLNIIFSMKIKKVDLLCIQGVFRENFFSHQEMLDKVLTGLQVQRLVFFNLTVSDHIFFLLIQKIFDLVQTFRSIELSSNLPDDSCKKILTSITNNHGLQELSVKYRESSSLDWTIINTFRRISEISKLHISNFSPLSLLCRVSRSVQFSLTEISIKFSNTELGIICWHLTKSSLLNTLNKVSFDFYGSVSKKFDGIWLVQFMNNLRKEILFKANIGTTSLLGFGIILPFVFSRDDYILHGSSLSVAILNTTTARYRIEKKNDYLEEFLSKRWKVSKTLGERYVGLSFSRTYK